MAEVHRQIQNQLEEMVSRSLPGRPEEGGAAAGGPALSEGRGGGEHVLRRASPREACAALGHTRVWGIPRAQDKSHMKEVTIVGPRGIQEDLREQGAGQMGSHTQLATKARLQSSTLSQGRLFPRGHQGHWLTGQTAPLSHGGTQRPGHPCHGDQPPLLGGSLPRGVH